MCSILPPHPANHVLPDFRSLVIQGHYPASAPIHLCVSHLSSGPPTRKPLLLSSSNSYLANELEEYNDAWIAEHSGKGAVAELLHQIDIFYPPTRQHLQRLLARLRTYSTPGADRDSETDLTACLARAPTLIVLHELSRYFLAPDLTDDDDVQEIQLPTLSTYMQLVIDAIAALGSFSSSRPSEPPRLVVFDKQLDALVLPIFRPVNLGDITKLPKHSKALVTDALERYMGWFGTVEKFEYEEIASSQPDEVEIVTSQEPADEKIQKTHFKLTLRKSPHGVTRPGVAHEQVFEWYSYRGSDELPFTTRRRTFVIPV